MKIYSWNVNGLRAVLKKGAFDSFLNSQTPDILCLQETKAQPGQAEIDLPAYTEYWNSATRPGYSGTAIFSSLPALNYHANLPTTLLAQQTWQADNFGDPLTEGRLQTLEFDFFYLVNVYTPNSKRELQRLKLRQQIWDPNFLSYLKYLEQTKPVIVCGDFNAAHTEIDLARPKDNHKNAGFTDEERQGITNLIQAGFVDTFRTLHPDQQRYSWWSHWAKARERNIGWRIDYFFISQALLPNLKTAEIHEKILGSDHCPISIELEF